MAKHKRTRKRDPSREPYASPHTDMDSRKLAIHDVFDELVRATRKAEAARQQVAGGRILFAEPDLSEMSATATVLALRPLAETLAEWGKQTQGGRSAGGKTRAEQRKDKAAAEVTDIHKEATALLDANKARREISGILMKRGFGSRTKILRALRSHPSDLWAPRKRRKSDAR